VNASPRRPRTAGPAVPTNEFATAEVYAFTSELEKLHPDNRHVRDKIRQQLQVLRDMGLLIHLGRGEWRLPDPAAPQERNLCSSQNPNKSPAP